MASHDTGAPDGSLPQSILDAALERAEADEAEGDAWDWSLVAVHHYDWRTAADDDMDLERKTVDYRVER